MYNTTQAGDPDYADIQATLMRQLQEKYTWPSQWLLGARNSMLTGQLSDDKVDISSISS